MGKPGSSTPPLEGAALPNPPAGGGMGEPGSPMVTSGPMRGAHRARCNRPGSAGVPPTSRLRGRDARAPSLCSPLPSMRLAPHPDGMNILPGRTSPSQTLPPGGEMGKPGFPIPLRGDTRGGGVCHPAYAGWHSTTNPSYDRSMGACSPGAEPGIVLPLESSGTAAESGALRASRSTAELPPSQRLRTPACRRTTRPFCNGTPDEQATHTSGRGGPNPSDGA